MRRTRLPDGPFGGRRPLVHAIDPRGLAGDDPMARCEVSPGCRHSTHVGSRAGRPTRSSRPNLWTCGPVAAHGGAVRAGHGAA
eukprot:5792902-Prymnesium_polylepis.1